MYRWPTFDEFMRISSNGPTARGSCGQRPVVKKEPAEVEVITLDDSDSEKTDVKPSRKNIGDSEKSTEGNKEICPKKDFVPKDLTVKIEFQNFRELSAGKKKVSTTPKPPTDGAPHHIKCRSCRLHIAAYGFRDGRWFFKLAALKRHASCHLAEKFWGCPLCTASFVNRDYAKAHIFHRHKSAQSPRNVLPLAEFDKKLEKRLTECFGIGFDAIGVPQSNLVTKTAQKEEKICAPKLPKPPRPLSEKVQCKICTKSVKTTRTKNGKTSFLPSELRQHCLLFHSQKYFVKCPLCNKNGKTSKQIKQHLRRRHGQVGKASEPIKLTEDEDQIQETRKLMTECFGLNLNGAPNRQAQPLRKRLSFKSEHKFDPSAYNFAARANPRGANVDGAIKKFDGAAKKFDGAVKRFNGATKKFDGAVKKFETDRVKIPKVEIPDKKVPKSELNHSGTKKCKICRFRVTCEAWKNGKLHSASSHLRRHVAVHMDGRYQQCPFCEKRTRVRQSLIKHIKLDHKTRKVVPDSFLSISEKEYNDKVEVLMKECFEVDFHGKAL